MLALLKKSRKAPAAVNAGGEPEESRYGKLDLAMLRRMGRTLYPFRMRYVLGISLAVPEHILAMSGPLFMQHLINYTINETHERTILHVLLIILGWSAAMTGSIIFQRFVIRTCGAAGEAVQADLRRQIFAKLQSMSMSYYDKTKLGRIISRCTSDVNSMRDVNVWGIVRTVVLVMDVSIAAIMLAWTDWRLFLAVAWLGPVLVFANRQYLMASGLMWQTVREGFTRVSTNLAENITGARVVTAFDRQEPNLNVFNRLQITNTANNMDAARLNGLYQPSLELIRFVGRVIILSFGAYLIVRGHITGGVGAVVASFLYWDWFMNPIVDFGNFYNTIMQAMAGAERVYDLLDTKPDVQDDPAAKDLPPIRGEIAFDHVTFGYNADRPILHDVSFSIPAGSTLALVGATGSGKSSIVSLIARFYQPQQGRVLVDGIDIRHITGESLHKQTGLVLQANYLFSGTVYENIKYSRPEASEADVIAAATAIGSHDTIMLLKNGYRSDVGERGANMSLGQRQLICFTRAYLANPRIFMLDEATSAVDTATELLVQNSLEKLLKDRTTVIVAHRLSTIMNADQILVIDAGKIVERGNHRSLVSAGGKYAHLYEQFAMHRE